MRSKVALALVVLLTICGSLLADRGSVPFKANVEIYEPHQRALIAWNGDEEILILSTDMRALQKTKVLEILPLPSKPTIQKANVEIFRAATRILNEKLRLKETSRAKEGEETRPDLGGMLIFYKRIGVHEISLTHATDKQRFVDWANSLLKAGGADTPTIPDELATVREAYIADGYTWFAFDVVTLDPSLTTSDAVQYRFKTDMLYYPLRITRTETGYTRIDLQVITKLRLKQFPGIHTDRVALLHEPVELNTYELRELSPDVDELLGHPESCLLRIWQMQGPLNGFRQDLLAK